MTWDDPAATARAFGIGEVWSVASVNQVRCRTRIYLSFRGVNENPDSRTRTLWSCSYILSSADAVATKFIEFSNTSALRGSHRRPHKYAFDMRFISHLEMDCFPKNTEIHRRSFVRVGRLRRIFAKSVIRKWISLITKRLSSALAVDAQGVRTTAEDNGVLDFVNEKLPQVTNVGRFQCLS
jgi:hypothetical protein